MHTSLPASRSGYLHSGYRSYLQICQRPLTLPEWRALQYNSSPTLAESSDTATKRSICTSSDDIPKRRPASPGCGVITRLTAMPDAPKVRVSMVRPRRGQPAVQPPTLYQPLRDPMGHSRSEPRNNDISYISSRSSTWGRSSSSFGFDHRFRISPF